MDDASFQELDGEEGTYRAVQTADYKDHLELSKELEAKTEHFSSAVQSYRFHRIIGSDVICRQLFGTGIFSGYRQHYLL